MSKSICDEQFLDVGKKDGICIWRIEDFKLIRLKETEYGSIFFKVILPRYLAQTLVSFNDLCHCIMRY